MATLAEYHNKVFTRHAVDMLINKARPIRDVLQRFNKKDSAMVEEPNERDLATLMKFIEHNTLQTLSKLFFVASGAKYSIATNIMTLETLLTHPAEFAKKTSGVSRRASLQAEPLKGANGRIYRIANSHPQRNHPGG